MVYPIPEVAPRAGARYTGRVHVLVDRHTYSNAANVAAVVQDYGFGRVLGEETSDLASTLGAMEHFTLPGSGLVVGYPKARILRPSGDPTPRGVVPDVVLPSPVATGADDPVMQAALEAIRAQAGRADSSSVSTGAKPPPGVRKFVVWPCQVRAANSSGCPRYA